MTTLIKTEFQHGPLDGSKLQAPEDVMPFSSADPLLLHLYRRQDTVMVYEGMVDRESVPAEDIYKLPTLGLR